MAFDPQGLFIWPGMLGFISGSFTFGNGVEPCEAVLKCLPQPFSPDVFGTLAISYGGVVQEFPNCMLDYIQIEQDKEGVTAWVLHIKDRRWKWLKFGWISGIYNKRLDDSGTSLREDTVQLPQELAELCLEKMGEFDYDVTELPNETYPEISWDGEVAARALLALADPLGCRIVLSLDNAVRLFPSGIGRTLPFGDYISGSVDLNPPNMPTTIRARAGQTKVQYDFTLVAATKEKDGSIVKIDDASYRPQQGWGVGDPLYFNAVGQEFDEDSRKLAEKYVYKLYMVDPDSTPQFDTIDPDNVANSIISNLDRLMLETEQLTKAPDTDEEPGKPLPAWVYGVYSLKGALTGNSIAAVDPTISEAEVSKGYYDGRFTIDAKRQTVLFEDQVYQEDSSTGAISPADLRLRTSCRVEDRYTNFPICYSKSMDVPGALAATQEELLTVDNVAREIIYSLAASGGSTTTDNISDIVPVLEQALASAIQKYQLEDPATVTYAGLRFDIQLDGAIQQIQWIIDDQGNCTTVASRNREDTTIATSYAEQKKNAAIKAALEKAKQPPRVALSSQVTQANSFNFTKSSSG